MKKLFSSLMAIVSLLLTSCGNQNATSTHTTVSPSNTSPDGYANVSITTPDGITEPVGSGEITDGVVVETDHDTYVVQAKHLPILLRYDGVWLDQDGEPMDEEDCEAFFSDNRHFGRVATTINEHIHFITHSIAWSDAMDQAKEWSTSMPHDPDEHFRYDWCLSTEEDEEISSTFLTSLNANIIHNPSIDLDAFTTTARTAAKIILQRLAAFCEDGTFESARHEQGWPTNGNDVTTYSLDNILEPKKPTPTPVSPTTNGCNDEEATGNDPSAAPSEPPHGAPASHDHVGSDSQPSTGSSQLDQTSSDLTSAQEAPETAFDIAHPDLYFDELGYSHDKASGIEGEYFALPDGSVYKVTSPFTGTDGASSTPVTGNYVGTTSRLK